MLLDWLEHTLHAIDELLAGIDTDVEPGVALHSHLDGHTLQRHELLLAHVAQFLLGATQMAHHLAQWRRTVALKSINEHLIVIEQSGGNGTLGVAHILLEQIPNYLGLLGTHHQTEEVFTVGVALATFLAFAREEEDIDHQGDEAYLHSQTSIVHCGANHGGCDEGGTGCDKPSTDDRQHAGDAEHGTLATPGPVGKR